MRNGFTLSAFFLALNVAAGALASDKEEAGLKTECQFLSKELDRVQGEVERYSQEFQAFNTQLKNSSGSNGFLNRATAWTKSALFALDSNLKSVNDLYENCMCAAAKITLADDLKRVLSQTQQKYYQLRNRAMGLKTALTTFKNKIQLNLN